MAVTLEEKQLRIVRTLEGPLFVSAGAGSGKTFTLTQRVLYALTPGSKPREQWTDPNVPEPFLDSIDQVLAITFTDKAARELKERIRAALIEANMPGEAEKVDDAWISTIHGMCSRIIRAYALDLHIDPAFSVAGYADDLKRRAVEHVVRRVAASDASAGGGAFDAVLRAFDLEGAGGPRQGAASLLDILVAILSKLTATVGGFSAFEQVRPRPSHVELLEAYRDIADTTSYANCDEARVAYEALETYLASARDLPALRACYASCGALSLRGKGMGKDEKSFVSAVRAARARFFAEAYLATCSEAFDELMPLAEQVADEYSALKRERGVLDNDDLLTLAYDALTTDPEIRAAFSGKFKMVMVDEFQDTAQQQVELVRLLCSPDARELCTVGDAQQSIYRFRGADVSVFCAMKASVEAGGTGVVRDLDVNYRSHADILSFADRIFEGGAENRLGRDFLHLVSCGEEKRRGAHALRNPETSRRQAVLVVGGSSEERAQAKAAAIAARFRRLHDEEKFNPGDMVILMARLSKADVYAEAVRAAGMPCVVSGGTSVFARAPEVQVIQALLAFLANPDDGEQGIAPLITSPMFCLGAQELVALATCIHPETGIVDTRTITGDVLLSGEVLEEFGELPLLERARTVLGRAIARVGRDRVSQIARDAVAESGWLSRLEQGGAPERACAANVLKALAIVEDEEEGRAYAPRLVARAFADHIAHAKESPAVLSGADEDAVRIMTIHASKGLEFPVVAVVESDGPQPASDRFLTCDRDGRVLWCALPNRFADAADEQMLTKSLDELGKLDDDELEADRDRGSAMPRAAVAAIRMKRERAQLDYEEAARLLYVAITRAREVCIVGMGARYATELEPGNARSLVGEVLVRILPPSEELAGLPDLGADRLAFPNAHAGDYQLVLLDKLTYPAGGGKKRPTVSFAQEDYPLFMLVPDAPVKQAEGQPAPEPKEREVLLVEPALATFSALPASRASRDSYSYTSLAAALHAEPEDRASASCEVAADEASSLVDDDAPLPAPRATGCAGATAPSTGTSPSGDPTALGSAFHAAAQWLIETGAASVPAGRVDALARYWGVTPAQRERLDVALARWERSAVRAEMRSWPQVRAEVPFFALGDPTLRERFGSYVEGAIDVLCTDPARPGEAFVLDYKTGGSPAETPEQLHEKHQLQARVYAEVLHGAGYQTIAFAFVRVEIEDPAAPREPQVARYRFSW